MPILNLAPTSISDNAWAFTDWCGPVLVRAKNPRRARPIAADAFRQAQSCRIDVDRLSVVSPWQDERLGRVPPGPGFDLSSRGPGSDSPAARHRISPGLDIPEHGGNRGRGQALGRAAQQHSGLPDFGGPTGTPDAFGYRNDRPAVLHRVDLTDGQPATLPGRGIFLAPYVCIECGRRVRPEPAERAERPTSRAKLRIGREAGRRFSPGCRRATYQDGNPE